jgi:uncharacterized protein
MSETKVVVPPCNGCGACCYVYNVQLMSEDLHVVPITPEILKNNKVEFKPRNQRIPQKYLRSIGFGYQWMKRRKDGSCVALDRKTNTCKIYDKRPHACVVYERGTERCKSAINKVAEKFKK